jgi:hypothetical protein
MSDQWMDRLSEYLDDELTDGERIALEAHLQGCGECAAVLADLRQVTARARRLENRAPTNDLWPSIARRIGANASETPPVNLASRKAARRWSFSLPQLAAAGIALMTVSGGTVWLLRGPVPQDEAPVIAGPSGTPPAVNAGSTTGGIANQSIATAVSDLEQVLQRGRGQLDTTTVRVIEQNLAAIDRAIAQAQQALNTDPANLYLNTHLAETMRRKLDLLRQAAALVPVS